MAFRRLRGGGFVKLFQTAAGIMGYRNILLEIKSNDVLTNWEDIKYHYEVDSHHILCADLLARIRSMSP